MALTARQCIELFQLVFLRAVAAKGEDKALIALKGGCNLRFYFRSPRHSEDIDFDVGVIAKNTLKNKIDRLLKSPVVLSPLRSNGIDIENFTAPKQTDTIQRWKVGLRFEGIQFPLRTKVEFSRRDSIEGTAFESIEWELLRTYGLTPSLAAHYTSRTAIAQKVHALAGRAEPQARDIFDLSLLFSRPDARAMALGSAERRHVGAAIENAMAISFDEYRSKVVAYLDPAQASPYEGRAAWDAMQGGVVDQLEALR
jgi:predicted nucleotidyltransferase component of viral defense system